MLLQEVVWVVTCVDTWDARRWFGLESYPGRRAGRRRVEPVVVWDTIQCQRTVQFATRQLAEGRAAELREDLAHYLGDDMQPLTITIEEEDRVFLQSVIGMVHAPGWDGD